MSICDQRADFQLKFEGFYFSKSPLIVKELQPFLHTHSVLFRGSKGIGQLTDCVTARPGEAQSLFISMANEEDIISEVY